MRKFTKMSLAKFKSMLDKYCYPDSNCLDPSEVMTSIHKDLKVEFDWENFYTNGDKNDDEFMGYHCLSNGMCFLGCWAAGDWQKPVHFLLYPSGNKIRAYVPKNGNLWNWKTKEAYGNDNEADYKDAKRRFPKFMKDCELEDFDSDLIDGYDIKAMLEETKRHIVADE